MNNESAKAGAPRMAPRSRLTLFNDIAHCTRCGLVGGAGRSIPLPTVIESHIAVTLLASAHLPLKVRMQMVP